MNEKRSLSTTLEQEENPTKKKKVELLDDESSLNDFYQECENHYNNLSEKLTQAKNEKLRDKEIHKFFLDIIENRCLIGDIANDHNNLKFAATYYQQALDIYDEWDCYGTPSSQDKIIMGEKHTGMTLNGALIFFINSM